MNVQPVPTDEAHFRKAKGLGPFNCHNCVYMQTDGDGNGCLQPVMRRTSNLPRNGQNLPVVDKGDHCKFVSRPGDD